MPVDDYCADAGQFDAAGWVLGALDPGDAERFTEHLLTCQECQLAVAELEPAGRLLISPATRPPARLEAATLARIRQAADLRRRPSSRPLMPVDEAQVPAQPDSTDRILDALVVRDARQDQAVLM